LVGRKVVVAPGFVSGGTVVGTDLAIGAAIVEGGTVAALDGGQAQIDAARMSRVNNYFYGNDVKAETMTHHLGFYYQGQIGIIKPFIEAVAGGWTGPTVVRGQRSRRCWCIRWSKTPLPGCGKKGEWNV
jgi:hypothetical protein